MNKEQAKALNEYIQTHGQIIAQTNKKPLNKKEKKTE